LLFGDLLAPTVVSGGERTFVPKSLQRLDQETAAFLRAIMETAEQGSRVAVTIFSEMPILWAIDNDGEIWFALEEVVDPQTGKSLYPLVRNQLVRALIEQHNLVRLGHPALLRGEHGRIAGDILYDDEAPGWFISNNSGRYGRRLGRSEEQLENVRLKFEEHSIHLKKQFIQARST